ncbi:MAG: hypothetical protein RIA09_08845 [Hoeflea sp.]|jgi:hypothetical protein|uniref:hypothetical protein n=1 Tax=Hoeflea sp. TaxID=1940281 RepID=UPI0032ECC117
MSDIGIFSTLDMILLVLVGCAPGFVIGAGLGAWIGVGGRGGNHPRRRLIGAAIFGFAGFALAFAGWFVYLTEIK